MEISLLTESDGPALWQFENAYRQHFESWINARPVAFYTPQGFAQALQTGLLQQAADQSYHYLIREDGVLAGRINLTQVKRQHFHSALLGYRIAPTHEGQGLASQAVAEVMQKAFHTHQLQRLEATARPENPASIRVLVKNGFQQFGHSRCSLQLHRQWFDLLYFEAHVPQTTATEPTASSSAALPDSA